MNATDYIFCLSLNITFAFFSALFTFFPPGYKNEESYPNLNPYPPLPPLTLTVTPSIGHRLHANHNHHAEQEKEE
jgi:hypothetical protein